MDIAGDRPEFAPPQEPGLLRGVVLAVLAHVLLVLALMHGLQWQRETVGAVAEAELWSALPKEAAPKEQPAPPPPPPPPPPAPVVKAPPVPAPVQRDAQIALEREKEKRELEEKRQREELQREREEEKRKLEAQKKHEQELARKREQELEARRELEAKREQEKKLLAEAKHKEEEKRKLEEQKRRQEAEAREAKVRQMAREDQMRRIQAMTGNGGPQSTGNAARSSGPSAGYAGRVAALIKRNTRFPDTVPGDPPVEVEVRLAPDGTIVGQRIVKSSGNRARDEAVLRGIEATERLPRDTDGSIHTPMIISVRQFT
jgi:colicin import membrane protein